MRLRVQSGTMRSYDRIVPLLLDADRLSLDIGSSLGHGQELLLHLFELLGLLDRRGRSRRRKRIVDEENGRLLSRLRREEDEDVLVLVERLDPDTKIRCLLEQWY